MKSSTVEAPKLSSSVSMRFGIGRMAPLGRSRSRRYMFSGEVKMWRSIVTGRIATKRKKLATWATHQTWWAPARLLWPSMSAGERVGDERPLLELGSPLQGDAPHLGAEAGDGDGEDRAEDQGVLGLGLDADPVGPLHVPADDRPRHADEQQEARRVADRGVALVHVAVEELRRLRELVVDLRDRGDGEQDQEREVDEAVHDPGGGIPQQGLHVHAGSEVLEAAAGVLAGGLAVVGRAPLPVAHPLAEEHRPVEDRTGSTV